MGEEISVAKIQARHIVEQRRGTPMEPTLLMSWCRSMIQVTMVWPGEWRQVQGKR